MAVTRRGSALRWGLAVLTGATTLLALVSWCLTGEPAGQLVVDLLGLLLPIAYGGVGAVLTTRRPENAVGWLCQWIGLVWGVIAASDAVTHLGADRGSFTLAGWVGALGSLWVVAVVLTLHLALRLPNGLLLSQRWRPASWLCTTTLLVLVVLQGTAPEPVNGVAGTSNPLAVPELEPLAPLFALLLVSLVLSVASLVLRYRRADRVERLQLRWIALSLVLLLAVGGTIVVVVGGGTLTPVATAVDTLANATLPVAIGIAVTRYRLYDIDVIINRALVYGSVTAALAMTYVALVLVLQFLVDPFSDDSALVTAVSTLAVAALFRPLRNRIQESVDRRFYRSRYDATRTLERFGSRLRDDVDLQSLSDDLRAVTAETLQPTHVSIWLRASQS